MPMVSRTHCLRLIATVHCSNLDVYFAAIAVSGGRRLNSQSRHTAAIRAPAGATLALLVSKRVLSFAANQGVLAV